MTRHLHCALAFALFVSAPVAAAAQDAMAVLNAAAKAMRLEQVNAIRYTATGSAFAIRSASGNAIPEMVAGSCEASLRPNHPFLRIWSRNAMGHQGKTLCYAPTAAI